jgi:predicted dehydrogenase
MAIKVGVLGIGFMGKCHFDAHGANKAAKVVAICDTDPVKRSGDWSGIAGNIGGAGKKVDLKGIAVYDDAKKMFADPNVEVVDITLPTYLHAKYAMMALKAGKHVICEKPMARTSAEAQTMIAAAKAAKRHLFVSHCIRFWPAYAKACEIVKSKKYGKVLSANFYRVSTLPTWSWDNWLLDSKRSGDCALDLHIHDADFVCYMFGKPKSVTSHAVGFKKGRFDHILTSYEFPGAGLVTTEGAWEYAPQFPFSMSFKIVMEKASLDCPSDLNLKLFPMKGKPEAVKVPAGDGYTLELKHFLECIAKNKNSDVLTTTDALNSVKLIEAEMKSATTKKPVTVKF